MRRLRLLLTSALLCAFAACGSPSTTESPTAAPTLTSQPTAMATSNTNQLADLTISDMQVVMVGFNGSCAPSWQGGVELRVTIQNVGGAASGGFVVDGNGARETVGEGLAPGQSRSLTFSAVAANVVIVDATDQVAESNEANNTRSLPAPTMTPPPLCTATPSANATPARPTEAPAPTTPVPDAALAAELSATAVAGLPPTATPKPGEGAGFGGISAVGVLPLRAAGDARPLWAAYSQGERSFDPPQNHFVAVYARGDAGWRELSRLELEDPDIVEDGGVAQVTVEPANTWLEVQSGVGAHGGCYNLLRFDGQALRQEVAHCYESPDAGYLSDLNGDGVQEVILNQTRNYVFCYACGVRAANFQVLRWDGTQMVEVRLTPLPDSAPAELRRLTNQAIELAQAGLWKDTQATISQTEALNAQDEMAVWDAALIRLVAEARAEQAQSGAYPLLDHLFYGDYAAALDVMRSYTPEQLFGAESPLVVGTTAEGWEPQLANEITSTVDMALTLKPDLAAAYFLRGWAIHLAEPANPGALADIERAAQLDPNEALFRQSLAFLKKK